jgi:hypothetical protein
MLEVCESHATYKVPVDRSMAADGSSALAWLRTMVLTDHVLP